MAIPQHIVYGVGGTVTVEASMRHTAATVACMAGNGDTIFSAQAATVSTINTTLSGAVSAGATSIVVSSATGFTSGKLFYIVGDAEELTEACHVKSVSSTTITLTTPLLFAHANSAVVNARTLTYAVTGAQASTRFWDGHLTWIGDTTSYYYDHVVCSDYPLSRVAVATEQTLFKIEPHMRDVLDPNESADRLLDLGFEDVIAYLNSTTSGRAWSYLGPPSFELATGYAAMVHHYRNQAGDAAAQLLERFEKAFAEEMKRRVDSVPRDIDGDGAAEESERVSARSFRMYRS